MSCHVEYAIPSLEGLHYRTGVEQEVPHIYNPLQSPWKSPVYEEKQGDSKREGQEGVTLFIAWLWAATQTEMTKSM